MNNILSNCDPSPMAYRDWDLYLIWLQLLAGSSAAEFCILLSYLRFHHSTVQTCSVDHHSTVQTFIVPMLQYTHLYPPNCSITCAIYAMLLHHIKCVFSQVCIAFCCCSLWQTKTVLQLKYVAFHLSPGFYLDSSSLFTLLPYNLLFTF